MEAATAADVTDRTLRNWLNCKEFQELLRQCKAEILAKMQESEVEEGLRRTEQRMAALEKICRKLEAIIEERANAAGPDSPPGAKTGLLEIREPKNYVRRARKECEFGGLDVALVSQLRQVIMDAQKIMGDETAGSSKPIQVIVQDVGIATREGLGSSEPDETT